MRDGTNPTRKLRDSLSSLDHEPSRVFPPDFMRSHTDYDTFEHFLEQQGWIDSKGDLRYEVTVGDADEAVRENTGFEDWHEMVSVARKNLWEHPRRNRRRFERYDCDVNVLIEVGVNAAREGRLVDVSKKGLGLEVPKPVPPARTLTVKLPLKNRPIPSNPLEIRGVVRWREDGANVRMGVELLDKTG